MNKNYDYKRLTPFKWFVLQNFPFIDEDFDAITNYQLFCKLGEEINKLIVSMNQAGNQVEELTEYVSTYFDNLDVQEEINNKLDEMAESGQLTDIIAQYLQLAGLLCFNTKSDMKNAENLVNGSFAKTYGTLAYNDGLGNFYKIRTLLNTDVVDEDNIIALTNYPTLVAEKIPNAYITNLQNQLNTINNDINNIENKIYKKLSLCKNSYFYQFNLQGNKFALSYEKITNNSNPFNIQGICYNPIDGEIYANDGSSIFKLKEGEPAVKENLYNIDLGHGGDCCIYNNFMYIVDYSNYNIHKVNLANGNDTIYNISVASITNTNTSGTPRIGGICIKETKEILIAVNDEYTDHTQVANNSTLRIYEFDISTEQLTKIFEIENSIVYIQGMTIDNDCIYIVGNKAFTTNYQGNKLFVINKFTKNLIDILENNNDLEFEGLDYYCKNGIEGILTSLNKYNSTSHFGIYSFYGNTTRLYTETTENSSKYITISKGGQLNVRFEITGSYSNNQTYTFSNFLKNNAVKIGSAVPIMGYGKGAGRNDICMYEYFPDSDELKIYPTTNLTKFICNFSVATY